VVPNIYLILQAGKLSGMGMQLTSSQQDPDRACQVACQDHQTLYRFLPTQINPKINKMILKGKAICCLHKGDEQSINNHFGQQRCRGCVIIHTDLMVEHDRTN
jgi:hypothetical protein